MLVGSDVSLVLIRQQTGVKLTKPVVTRNGHRGAVIPVHWSCNLALQQSVPNAKCC